MTPDERLHQALQECYGGWHWTEELLAELAARGLAVVEVKHFENTEDYPIVVAYRDKVVAHLAPGEACTVELSKGEPSGLLAPRAAESVSRGDVPTGNEGRQAAHPCSYPRQEYLCHCGFHGTYPCPQHSQADASSNGRTAPFEGVNAGSTPAASASSVDGMLSDATLYMRLRDRISELETRLEMNFAYRYGRRIVVPVGSIPDGIHCRDETIRGLDNRCDKLRDRISTLEAGLRDAIHQLTTRNGFWVSDKAAHEVEDGQPFHYRDDTTEAVKRLQAVLDGDSQPDY